jgi:hypothetical protein
LVALRIDDTVDDRVRGTLDRRANAARPRVEQCRCGLARDHGICHGVGVPFVGVRRGGRAGHALRTASLLNGMGGLVRRSKEVRLAAKAHAIADRESPRVHPRSRRTRRSADGRAYVAHVMRTERRLDSLEMR